MTYSELKQKEIINTCDGAKLGGVCDVELSQDGRILALIVPGPFTLASMFKGESLRIPWACVQMMGEDVILVTAPDAAGKIAAREGRDKAGRGGA